MTDDLQQRKAELYLSAYKNYKEINGQILDLAQAQTDAHKILCDAAGLFMGLSESEMTRVLCYWDSIASDARMVVGITE